MLPSMEVHKITGGTLRIGDNEAIVYLNHEHETNGVDSYGGLAGATITVTHVGGFVNATVTRMSFENVDNTSNTITADVTLQCDFY